MDPDVKMSKIAQCAKGHTRSFDIMCVLGTGSAASPVPEEDAEKLSVMQ